MDAQALPNTVIRGTQSAQNCSLIDVRGTVKINAPANIREEQSHSPYPTQFALSITSMAVIKHVLP